MVDELCAKDGGIRVYEVVRLPKSAFNKYGQINFYNPAGGSAKLGPVYVYEYRRTYLVRGPHETDSAHLVRQEESVYRKSDLKLLGKLVLYTRSGGDIIQPNIGSRHDCPAAAKRGFALFEQVFVAE